LAAADLVEVGVDHGLALVLVRDWACAVGQGFALEVVEPGAVLGDRVEVEGEKKLARVLGCQFGSRQASLGHSREHVREQPPARHEKHRGGKPAGKSAANDQKDKPIPRHSLVSDRGRASLEVPVLRAAAQQVREPLGVLEVDDPRYPSPPQLELLDHNVPVAGL
jgi:hypothetical protein